VDARTGGESMIASKIITETNDVVIIPVFTLNARCPFAWTFTLLEFAFMSVITKFLNALVYLR
jgi:hypothetical protein